MCFGGPSEQDMEGSGLPVGINSSADGMIVIESMICRDLCVA